MNLEKEQGNEVSREHTYKYERKDHLKNELFVDRKVLMTLGVEMVH